VNNKDLTQVYPINQRDLVRGSTKKIVVSVQSAENRINNSRNVQFLDGSIPKNALFLGLTKRFVGGAGGRRRLNPALWP
jgi:hypothetical protein